MLWAGPSRLPPVTLGDQQPGVLFLRQTSYGRGPPLGVAAPAGLPVILGAGLAAGLARDRLLAAVPALAEHLGPLASLLRHSSLCFPPLWVLPSEAFVLPSLLGRGRSRCWFRPGLVGPPARWIAEWRCLGNPVQLDRYSGHPLTAWLRCAFLYRRLCVMPGAFRHISHTWSGPGWLGRYSVGTDRGSWPSRIFPSIGRVAFPSWPRA